MKPQKKSSSSIRVIGGRWRGRKLAVAAAPGLRPTGNRNRETLFNWIQFDLAGRNCLDVFAGSGALGIEALSRGAASLVALEQSGPACQVLQANLKALQAPASAHCVDSLTWLDRAATQQFDLVFLDPPFASRLQQPALEKLQRHQWLATDCLIYIEQPASGPEPAPDGFKLRRSARFSRVSGYLFEASQ